MPNQPLREGTLVTYNGSKQQAHGYQFRAYFCGCPNMTCTDQYELDLHDDTVLQHVRRASITPVTL